VKATVRRAHRAVKVPSNSSRPQAQRDRWAPGGRHQTKAPHARGGRDQSQVSAGGQGQGERSRRPHLGALTRRRRSDRMGARASVAPCSKGPAPYCLFFEQRLSTREDLRAFVGWRGSAREPHHLPLEKAESTGASSTSGTEASTWGEARTNDADKSKVSAALLLGKMQLLRPTVLMIFAKLLAMLMRHRATE
jgi:hypothetical protein